MWLPSLLIICASCASILCLADDTRGTSCIGNDSDVSLIQQHHRSEAASMLQHSQSVTRRTEMDLEAEAELRGACNPIPPKFLQSLTPSLTGLVSVEEASSRRPLGCSHPMPNSTRTLLLPLAFPFHGSTALEALLMSSKSLATLCSSESWQCEGRKIGQTYHEAGVPAHETDYSQIPEACRTAKSSYADMMSCYSHYWDISRPVLLEKSPCHNTLSLQEMREGISNADLPVALQTAGVAKIEFAYLLLWRPPCLSELSSHAAATIRQQGKEYYIQDEAKGLKLQMQAHQYLRQVGLPVLAINYADLLWQTDRVAQRLEEFMPCLGQIDADYIPKNGLDVFPGNQWKIQHGTVRAFGEKHSSTSVGYDVSSGTCSEEWEAGNEALEYLRKWS